MFYYFIVILNIFNEPPYCCFCLRIHLYNLFQIIFRHFLNHFYWILSSCLKHQTNLAMVFNIAIHNELLFKIQKPEIMIIFSVSARAGNYRLLVSAEENPFHASLEISLLNCKTEPTLHYYTKNILSHNRILNIIVAEYCLALCLHQLQLVNSLSPK